jgi:RNA polymerase sigma-70 factor (ECF subfamily)
MLVSAGSREREPGLDAEDGPSVESLGAPEREAFEELVRGYRGKIFGICYRYTANREDAEDLVQEVLLRVLRGLPAFRGEARLQTWLYRIAVNTCLNWVAGARRRDGARVEAGEIADPGPSPSERLQSLEAAGGIRLAVATLPERQRMTLVLRVFQELSYREIAEVMGCPIGTAKANFFFALKNLKKRLER